MKKLVALGLSVVMIFSLVIVNTSATENSSNIPFIEEYALNFMRTSQNDDDIELLTVKEMYDLDDNITGYYVLFQKDATPAGYVLISMLVEGNPVVDFALEGAGIFESNNNALLGKAQAKLVYTGPDCIFFDNGTNFLYSVMDRTSVNKTAVEKNYQQYIKSIDRATVLSGDGSIYDGVIDWSDAGLDTSSVFKINDFGAGTDYWKMETFSGGGVCAPTAGTNILWYWGFGRGASSVTSKVSNISGNLNKASHIFDVLYDGMGTTTIGGTWDTKVPDGYEEFFGESAGQGTWNYATISKSSSYNVYKDALDEQCPIHLQIRMNNNPFTTNGHDLFNFGYASGTDGTQYLFVMDGWNTYGRFVKYSYYPVVKGYKIWVNSN